MADFTPWQLAAKTPITARKSYVRIYDPYNFSHISVSNGTNPPEMIPYSGPYSAGAVPATQTPQTYTVISATGTNQPVMGSNFSTPCA